MASLPPFFPTQFFNGAAPAAAGKLYAFESGTTTPKTTWKDAGEAATNQHPITLDQYGKCDLWLGDGAYTFVLYDADGALIDSSDGVTSGDSAADVLRADLAIDSTTAKGANLIGWRGRTVGDNIDDRANVRNYGAVGDNVTDDTVAFQAAFDTGRTVYVPATADGYLTEELTFAVANQCLEGDGDASAINYKPGLAGIHLSSDGHPCTVRSVRLFGGADSSKSGQVAVGARDGLKIDFDTNTTISNVTVHGYSGRGISPRNAAANRGGGTALYSVKSYNNWSGIECGPTVAEYIRLGLITINGCREGLVVSSGNVTGAIGCVNDNDTNLKLVGTDPGIPNDGHGNLTGFLFNHAISYAVYAEDIRFGFNLDGNQFFYGNIYLKECKGISICRSEMQIAGAQFEGGGRNYVCDNRLYTAVGLPNTFTHNYNAVPDDTICTGNVQVEDAASPSNPAILYQSDTRQIIGMSAGTGDAEFLHFGETGLPDNYGLTWTSNGGSGVFKLSANNNNVLATNPTLQIDRATGKITAALVSLSNYANDAAAAAGGIPVGGLYRNGSVLMTRVV